jgi:hypothetical protein
MKMYGGVDVFLILALDEGELLASCPNCFTPGGKAISTHWIGGSVSPRTGLDDMKRIKILTLPGFKLQPSAVQPVASCYTDYAILALESMTTEAKFNNHLYNYLTNTTTP